MSRCLVLALLVAAAAGAPARADIWRNAIEGGRSAEPGVSEFHRAMQDGDDHASQATARMVSPGERKRHVELAIASYRKAADARPQSADPHLRIAATMDRFLVCSKDRVGRMIQDPIDLCTPSTFATFGPQMLNELDTAEKLAPLDPRWTPMRSSLIGTDCALFERALLRTKLVSTVKTQAERTALLEGAARDYERMVERTDDDPTDSDTLFSNLAETYMMLGRIDDAIDMYDKSLARGAGNEVAYGMAVALDRNGLTERSRQTLAKINVTAETIKDFQLRVTSGSSFFVPYGEVFYYYGLLEEYVGHDDRALEYWKEFVKSGAHPQYQAAAKRHIDVLTKKLAAHPIIRTYQPPEDDF